MITLPRRVRPDAATTTILNDFMQLAREED
jgi:hypothetical protein